MNKPPAFQFYAKDWLSSKSVLRMTPAQCGYYINLLAHCWDNDPPGTLPNDPDFLWKMARAESKEKFESESELVLEQFPVEKSGRKRAVLRFNHKLRSYYRAFCTQSKQKTEAAKARWKSKMKADASSPQCPASAFASASASAIKDKPPKIPRKQKPLAGYTEEFLKLWKVYPRGNGKFAAFKAFQKLNCKNGDLERIISAVEKYQTTDSWTRDGGKYIPHLSTFLNQRIFDDILEDEYDENIRPTSGAGTPGLFDAGRGASGAAGRIPGGVDVPGKPGSIRGNQGDLRGFNTDDAGSPVPEVVQ